MELNWIKFELGKSELKEDAVYLMKCCAWSEAGMSVAIWKPQLGGFSKYVTHYILLEE